MAIDTQQANVDIRLAESALRASTRALDRAASALPPFSEQVRQLSGIKSDALDLATRLEGLVNGN